MVPGVKKIQVEYMKTDGLQDQRPSQNKAENGADARIAISLGLFASSTVRHAEKMAERADEGTGRRC